MAESPLNPAALARPPRFSWPMRGLLFVLLFHMFFRATDILYPWADWRSELGIRRMPRGLPTPARIAALRAEADGSYRLVIAEFQQCGSSLLRFLCPWPEAKSRERLNSPSAWFKYTLAWTASRLAWCERIVAIDQEWAMFSPNVSCRKQPARARLIFADGTESTVRLRSDPPDLTSYWRWSHGKNLGIDPRISPDNPVQNEACAGYSNYLLHRHPRNEAGSPLQEIRFYQVTYDFAPPGVDPGPYYRDLMAQTRDHHAPLAGPTFYVYDVNARRGSFVEPAK